MRSGYETGFRLYRNVGTGVDYLTPVVQGFTDRIDQEQYDGWRSIANPEWPDGNCFEILDLHFHPDARGSLALSYEDLFLVAPPVPDFDVRPVVLVGTVDSSGLGNALVLQRCFPPSCANVLRSIIDDVWCRYRAIQHDWPREDFGHLIELPDFLIADVLRFSVGPRARRAVLHNPGVLDRFARTAGVQ